MLEPSSLTPLADAFRQHRRRPISPRDAFERAVSLCFAGRAAAWLETPLGVAGYGIAAALEEQGMADRHAHREPAYHNCIHFAEAVHAISWLLKYEARHGELSDNDCMCGVVAVLGHDYRHDGTRNSAQRNLETESWLAIKPLLEHSGVDAADAGLIRTIVLGTDPVEASSNHLRYATSSPGEPGRVADILRALANEADLAASATVDLGWEMGRLLAREWERAGYPEASTLSTYRGRLSFLNFCQFTTRGAREIGLDILRDTQIRAFAAVAEKHAGSQAPEAGAAWLDALGGSEARETYLTEIRACLDAAVPRR